METFAASQLVHQGVGARQDRGVELILGVGLQMAVELRSLNGDILHLPRVDLVEQVGVGRPPRLCLPCWCRAGQRPTAASDR